MLAKSNIFVENFEEFKVFKQKNNYSFTYIEFSDNEKFLKGLTNYIFKEEKLLFYMQKEKDIQICPSNEQYNLLYNNISKFLDENIENSRDFIIGDVKTEQPIKIPSEKIGKIGEYIFHLLMTRYFKNLCIIPKFLLLTNRNMAVHGIDALFYDKNSKQLMFGESKFTSSLSNGIRLINESLTNYEHQIKEEYKLILRCYEYKHLMPDDFKSDYGKYLNVSCDIETFIRKANIQEIAVPIFIGHESKNKPDIEAVFEKFKNIKTQKLLNLKTNYIFISFPLLDKDNFIKYALNTAKHKQQIYKKEIENG